MSKATENDFCVRIGDLHKSFGNLKILRGIDLDIKHKEKIMILGPSGGGKSTILRCLMGLETIDKGEILVENDPYITCSKKGNNINKKIQQQVGMVFQSFNLFPHLTVRQNLSYSKRYAKNKKQIITFDSVVRLLEIEHLLTKMPRQLSGGEKQRVAVARALINKPSVILADEPSGNLDSANRGELHELLFKLRDDFEQTFVIVTHDDHFALRSNKIIHIKDGIIENSKL